MATSERPQRVADHLAACAGLGAVAVQGEGRWSNPSPCPGWNAEAVVEHVIGFHDVLVLRPLGMKPDRPKGDPAARWGVTVPALAAALEPQAHTAGPVDDLLPALTTDVLVHTWDLARSLGVPANLDERLCRVAYEGVLVSEERLRSSGMYGPAVPVGPDADAETELVAFCGRDPWWSPPSGRPAGPWIERMLPWSTTPSP